MRCRRRSRRRNNGPSVDGHGSASFRSCSRRTRQEYDRKRDRSRRCSRKQPRQGERVFGRHRVCGSAGDSSERSHRGRRAEFKTAYALIEECVRTSRRRFVCPRDAKYFARIRVFWSRYLNCLFLRRASEERTEPAARNAREVDEPPDDDDNDDDESRDREHVRDETGTRVFRRGRDGKRLSRARYVLSHNFGTVHD